MGHWIVLVLIQQAEPTAFSSVLPVFVFLSFSCISTAFATPVPASLQAPTIMGESGHSQLSQGIQSLYLLEFEL